jgi:hypothetical protein
VNLPTIARKLVPIELEATLPDGSSAGLSGAQVAIVAHRGSLSADTVWTEAAVADGAATILLVGPDAEDQSGGLVVPSSGGDLWGRVLDSTEVDATFIERINVV